METLALILIILAVILAIWTAIENNKTILGKIVASFFLTLGYWVVVLFILFAVGEILWMIADKKETTVKTRIYGINKETTTTGSFVIGCGTIDNDYRYSYYVKYGIKSSFKLDDVSSKTSVIVEDEDNNPYIIKWKEIEIVNKDKWKNWFFKFKKTETLNNIEIHVPKGTIIQDFKGKL